MIDFPEVTRIHRRMPKEAFYKRLQLNKAVKDKFVSDVDRIFVENSLTMENLHLTQDSEVKEILLLSISLKKQEFDGKVVEAIAKQNSHKIVFLLIYEDTRQLALFHNKLYRTQWVHQENLELKASGISLDEIWNNFIEQIALYEERVEAADGLTIDQRLQLQEKFVKLEKQIAKTEAAAWKETQPKKRFDLYTRLQQYKQELEELKRGES